MNKIYLIGRLTKDLILKKVNGTNFVRFTLAVQRDYSKEDRDKKISEGKQVVDYVYVSVWGNQAKAMSTLVGKGNRVAIDGRLQINRVLKDNENKIYPEVLANNIEFIDYKDDNENRIDQEAEETYIEEDEFENDEYYYD